MTTDAPGTDEPGTDAPGTDTPPSRVAIRTSDGFDLRAEIAMPKHPTMLAVLCHPHPLHGGSMNAPILDQLFRDLPDAGVGCIRFNFRGVMGSEGMHGYGDAEQLDVQAAIDTIVRAAPGLPVMVAGWSFGADVALAVVDPVIAGWFLIAPPLRTISHDDMGAIGDPRPKLLAIPAHDQFNPPAVAHGTVESWTNASVEVIEGTDHFLNGRVASIARLGVAFASLLGTAPD